MVAGAGEGPYELRYVDGRFYEEGYFVPGSQTWVRCTDFDDGGGYDSGVDAANEVFVPAEWLASYRAAQSAKWRNLSSWGEMVLTHSGTGPCRVNTPVEGG